jgi:putative membrane protein
MKKVLLVFTASILLAGCATREQGGSGAADGGFGTVVGAGSQDAAFASEACQVGVTEVQIGKLAARNTNNRQVRALARKLTDDHARAEKELGQLFVRKGIPPEETLARDLQSTVEKLAQLRGREFDVVFKEQVIEDHQKVIALFEKQARQGTDSELKAFAERHLPRLREHLAVAERLDVSADHGAPDQQTATVNTYLGNPANRTRSIAR